MPEQNSIPNNERLALSVLLAAGADPGRLARWYADNSDHPHCHITTTIDAMKTAGPLGPMTQLGQHQLRLVHCAKTTLTPENAQMGT